MDDTQAVCPLCSRTFPADAIEAHVNAELEGGQQSGQQRQRGGRGGGRGGRGEGGRGASRGRGDGRGGGGRGYNSPPHRGGFDQGRGSHGGLAGRAFDAAAAPAARTASGQPMPLYIDSHCHMDEILERLRFRSYDDYKVSISTPPPFHPLWVVTEERCAH